MNIGLQDSCKTAAIVQSWCGCQGPNVKSLHRTQNAWLCLAIVSKWTVSSCAFKSICLLSPSLDSTNWPNMDSADSDTVHTALRAQSNQIHNKERFTSVVQEIQGISSLHQGFHSSVCPDGESGCHTFFSGTAEVANPSWSSVASFRIVSFLFPNWPCQGELCWGLDDGGMGMEFTETF